MSKIKVFAHWSPSQASRQPLAHCVLMWFFLYVPTFLVLLCVQNSFSHKKSDWMRAQPTSLILTLSPLFKGASLNIITFRILRARALTYESWEDKNSVHKSSLWRYPTGKEFANHHASEHVSRSPLHPQMRSHSQLTVGLQP